MISFAEIVQGRLASVRVTVDGLIYAVDLVMVMTGLNRNDAGQALRRLSDKVFHSGNLTERQLSSRYAVLHNSEFCLNGKSQSDILPEWENHLLTRVLTGVVPRRNW